MTTTVQFAPSRRQILAGGAGLGALVLLAACGASGTDGGGSGATDQLIVAWPADADSLDAQNSSSSGQDWDLWVNLYEVLLACKYVDNGQGVMVWDGIEVAPELADSWETKGDTITFHLSKTRKFYPTGNPLTADDVIFSYQRLFNLNKESLLNYGGVFSMDQITKVDDHTVQITCKDYVGKPQEAGPFQLACFRFPDLPILDSVEVKKHATSSDPDAKNWLKYNTAGTGPYYVKSRTIGQSMELAAVPGHPKNPAYKNVTIQVTGNVLSLVKGGSVNLAVYGMTQADVNSLASDTAVEAQFSKAPEFYYFEVPVDAGGPFADVRVRQALAYTIPYGQIIESLYGNKVTQDLSVVVTDANGYTPAWAKYATNLAMAKKLMARRPEGVVPTAFREQRPDGAEHGDPAEVGRGPGRHRVRAHSGDACGLFCARCGALVPPFQRSARRAAQQIRCVD